MPDVAPKIQCDIEAEYFIEMTCSSNDDDSYKDQKLTNMDRAKHRTENSFKDSRASSTLSIRKMSKLRRATSMIRYSNLNDLELQLSPTKRDINVATKDPIVANNLKSFASNASVVESVA